MGPTPISLLDSSKSVNIKSTSPAATVYLCQHSSKYCKMNCLYSVLPGKLEVIILQAMFYSITAILLEQQQ